MIAIKERIYPAIKNMLAVVSEQYNFKARRIL